MMGGDRNNWACGCASDDTEECRPFPRLHPERPDDDSDEDCGSEVCVPIVSPFMT
jgi:hypothetical protein